jgi:hypothetical protein
MDTLHNAGPIDTTGSVFAARLSSLLRTSRNASGAKLRGLARASGGALSVAELRRLEAGEHDLAGLDLPLLAGLYGIDLAALSSARVPIVVDAEAGRIQTAGLTRTFEPDQADSLLVAYLLLVRELRALQHEPTVTLRRDDIETLASSLATDGETVLARLGDLMGVTVAQRRSMVAAFVAGATLIALASGAIAIDVGNAPADPAAAGGATSAQVMVDPDAPADPLAAVPTGPSDRPAEDGAVPAPVGEGVATVEAPLPATSEAGPAPVRPGEPSGDRGTASGRDTEADRDGSDRGVDDSGPKDRDEPDPTGTTGETDVPPWQGPPEGPQGGNEPDRDTGPGSDDPGQGNPDHPGQGEPNLGEGNPGQGNPDHPGQGDPNLGEGNPGQGNPDHPGQGEPNLGQGNQANPGQGEPNLGEGNPGQGNQGNQGQGEPNLGQGNQGNQGQGDPNLGVSEDKIPDR